ncbi:MAG: hypothetical protein AAF492_21240, partial [Verrucomicrobiota bacterium]
MASSLHPDAAFSPSLPTADVFDYGLNPHADIIVGADAATIATIYGGWPAAAFGVQDSTASTSFTVPLWAACFSDRVHIGIIAAGEGTVTIGGTYTLDVASGDSTQTELQHATLIWGPAGTGLLAHSGPTNGAPGWSSLSIASPADVV